MNTPRRLTYSVRLNGKPMGGGTKAAVCGRLWAKAQDYVAANGGIAELYINRTLVDTCGHKKGGAV